MDRRHFLLAGSSLLPLYLAGCGGNDGPQPAPSPIPPPPPPPPVRRDVTTLTAAERQQFIDTLYAMKRATSSYDPSTNAYDYFVKLHVAAMPENAPMTNAHESSSFLPWHREMLMRFEKEMRKSSGNAQMSLPFWNWHQPKAHEKIFTNDFLGGNGDQLDGGLLKTGAFRVGVWALAASSDATPNEYVDPNDIDKAEMDPLPLTGLTRKFEFGGKAQPDLTFFDKYMSTQTVENLMSIKNYDAAPYMESMPMEPGPVQESDQWNSVSMRKTLEKLLHNPVHFYIGGQMRTASSPNDPVFFLHHCNVDRLWDLWQAKYGNTTYPTSAQDKMVGSESTLDVYAEKIVISNTFDLLKHSGVTYQTSTVS